MLLSELFFMSFFEVRSYLTLTDLEGFEGLIRKCLDRVLIMCI